MSCPFSSLHFSTLFHIWAAAVFWNSNYMMQTVLPNGGDEGKFCSWKRKALAAGVKKAKRIKVELISSKNGKFQNRKRFQNYHLPPGRALLPPTTLASRVAVMSGRDRPHPTAAMCLTWANRIKITKKVSDRSGALKWFTEWHMITKNIGSCKNTDNKNWNKSITVVFCWKCFAQKGSCYCWFYSEAVARTDLHCEVKFSTDR